MIRQVIVTFDFDPEEETAVTNLTCFIDGTEKKKKTTRTVKPKAEPVMEDEAIITLEPTKILINNKAVADMGLVYQDRLVIKYQKIAGNKKPVPIIGTDLAFDEEGTGNKLTKTNTLAYRGKANTILAESGTEFGLEEYKEGIWKLVSRNEGIKAPTTYKAVEVVAEGMDTTIFVDDDDTTEIGDMTFKL